ncbi:SPOSA6832_02777, partial [Sporobolomyces salmonicolor]
MLCANHSNSLTDALLLVTTVPPSKRSLLRLTAKDTQFGRGTFSSWLIEKAGTLPIKRPKDHLGQKVDNSVVFEKLIQALEDQGDMICMFPEGLSRYHPEIAPLKQGVARLVSDTLTRAQLRGDPEFRLAVQTVSCTYMHRGNFRSDVLVTFHPPIYVSAATHPDLVAPRRRPSLDSGPRSDVPPPPTDVPEERTPHERAIRSLTSSIGTSIRSGILDAPSWSYIRLANTCRRLYAPLGTKLSLGDHRFVDALAGKMAVRRWEESEEERDRVRKTDEKKGRASEVWKTPMREKNSSEGYSGVGITPNASVDAGDTSDGGMMTVDDDDDELQALLRDLKARYVALLPQRETLTFFTFTASKARPPGHDRVRNSRLLRRRTLLKRLFVRAATSALLLAVSIPGLVLWVPVFVVAKRESTKMVKKGPAWDTYDELTKNRWRPRQVAQTKLVYGFLTGVFVLGLCTLLSLRFTPFNLVFFPLLMWLTLRFLEDLASSLRALLALLRLLLLGKRQLLMLRSMRDGLRERVERVAVDRAGLPRDAGVFVRERERRWDRVGLGRIELGVGGWVGFFDPRRRRKKDWNEALKLFDQTEYAEDDPAALSGNKGD